MCFWRSWTGTTASWISAYMTPLHTTLQNPFKLQAEWLGMMLCEKEDCVDWSITCELVGNFNEFLHFSHIPRGKPTPNLYQHYWRQGGWSTGNWPWLVWNTRNLINGRKFQDKTCVIAVPAKQDRELLWAVKHTSMCCKAQCVHIAGPYWSNILWKCAL